MFNHPEHQFLYDNAVNQLKKCPNNWLLEIGSFTGTTAKVLAQAIADCSPDSYLVCVDPFYGHYDSGLQKLMDENGYDQSSWTAFNATLGELISHVIPIAAPTKRAEKLLVDCIGKYCLVFIDGDHSQEAVSVDLAVAYYSLGHSGMILLHDAKWESVAKASKEFVQEHNLELSYHCGDAIGRILC